jgi:meiotic recombination protein REC8
LLIGPRLRYAKDQLRSLPAAGSLTFEDVAPATIAAAHVAASVFYHCLGAPCAYDTMCQWLTCAVLATKDLVKVDQPGPYATITITKK